MAKLIGDYDSKCVQLTFKQGFETVMVLRSDPKEEVKIDGETLLKIEQVLNSETRLRCHAEVIDV